SAATHRRATRFPQPLDTLAHRSVHRSEEISVAAAPPPSRVDLIRTSRYTRALSLSTKGRQQRGQAEADVPTLQGEAEPGARVPEAQFDQGGPRGPQAAPRQGPQAPGGVGGQE